MDIINPTLIRKAITKRLVVLSWLAIIIIMVSQLLASFSWFAELFTHFTAHAIPVFFITAILTKDYKRWLFCFCGVILSIWAVMPFSVFNTNAVHILSSHKSIASKKPAIKIITANVNINHAQPTKKLNDLIAYQPDVLVLIEAGGKWLSALQTLSKKYPYGCGHEENSPFALHVFSKQPLASCKVNFTSNLPHIRAEIKNDGLTQIIHAIHPPPPINKSLASIRKKYLEFISLNIAEETSATLVTGDFNVTPYSPIFRDFIKQSQLQQTQHNASPTWFPFLLPLDHALIKNTPKTTTHRVARNGSDHNALLIQIFKPSK